jgi:hypothetical protein
MTLSIALHLALYIICWPLGLLLTILATIAGE